MVHGTWCTVLVATRIAASVSGASTGLPLFVLRARRGKLLLVTSTWIRLPARTDGRIMRSMVHQLNNGQHCFLWGIVTSRARFVHSRAFYPDGNESPATLHLDPKAGPKAPPSPSPQGTPEALPSPMRRRLYGTRRCEPLRLVPQPAPWARQPLAGDAGMPQGYFRGLRSRCASAKTPKDVL